MTKRLYLLRHSKAGQTNKKITDDHARPLTDKGVEACEPLGVFLGAQNPAPQLALCSTAVRTQQTLEEVLEVSGLTPEIQYLQPLYLAPVEMLFNIIRYVDDTAQSVLIVGHNPGLQQFAMMLSGKGDKKAFREMRSNFPPGSCAVLDIERKHWMDVSEQDGELVAFVTPKTATA